MSTTNRLIGLFIALAIVLPSSVLCQTCNAAAFTCPSTTSFQDCVDGTTPSGPTITCTTGTFCDATCSSPCLESVPCSDGVILYDDDDFDYETASPTSKTKLSKVFTCTAEGKVADPSNCKSYFICSLMADGSFRQANYMCPGESNFDPTTGKCSLLSTCNAANASTITTPPTTTPATTTTEPLFVCPTATGKFADPSSCSKYFMCLDSVVNSFLCPGTSLFDPTTSKCSTIYVCPL